MHFQCGVLTRLDFNWSSCSREKVENIKSSQTNFDDKSSIKLSAQMSQNCFFKCFQIKAVNEMEEMVHVREE